MKNNPSTPSPESELRRKIMDSLWVGSTPAVKATHTAITIEQLDKIMELVTAHMEAAVRSARIMGALDELDYWFGDFTYKDWKEQSYPTMEAFDRRLAQLRRTPASESENSDTVQQSKETSSE